MKRSMRSELPSELRAELERSRRAGHEYDLLAKLPQLRAALDASQAPADTSAPEQGKGSDPGSLTRVGSRLASSAWKLVLLAATLGAAVLVAWPALQRTARPAPPAAAPVKRHAESAPATPTSLPQAEPGYRPARTAPAEATAKEGPAASEAAPNPEPLVRSSRREIAQLVRIRALLERDPVAAYRLAQQSEREFPHGVLSEERQALQVLALVKSGSADAAERSARAFFARYPQSPMRKRLEAALAH